MLVRHIEGATRIVGVRQGYQGLPLRDGLMHSAVTGPGTPTMTTAWEPTPEEIGALLRGASIHVCVIGNIHPPIMVSVGPLPTEEDSNGGKEKESPRPV
jgi:hypothetical protein